MIKQEEERKVQIMKKNEWKDAKDGHLGVGKSMRKMEKVEKNGKIWEIFYRFEINWKYWKWFAGSENESKGVKTSWKDWEYKFWNIKN